MMAKDTRPVTPPSAGPRPAAYGFINELLDPGTFLSWDQPPDEPTDISGDYREALAHARRTAGTNESALTGAGTLGGRPIAVIVSEFGFLGGSIGIASAERIEQAIRRATAQRLPILAAPASGGTRMQEGTLAFVRMISITAAITAHREAGLPYLVYLRHPTTGGVFASWGSLGHVTFAEPGALLGFVGPRVSAALNRVPFPPGIQTAENLARHGLIDAVAPFDQLRALLLRTLRIIMHTPEPTPAGDNITGDAVTAVSADSAWEMVLATRSPARPSVRDLLADFETVPLLGSASGARLGLATALAQVGQEAFVLIGQDAGAQRGGQTLGPADLRLARRCIRLAGELGLPLVTVIDTPGASMSRNAEESGLSMEIALCLTALLTVAVPTVAVLLGEGAGGGALAFLPADRIVAVSDAWLAPLPPEGSSAVMHKGDPSNAAAIAQAQGITVRKLAAAGIVDAVVSVPGRDVASFAHEVLDEVIRQIVIARLAPEGQRIKNRPMRFNSTRIPEFGGNCGSTHPIS
jgi:acyl-CoA carboxylase subunit beta